MGSKIRYYGEFMKRILIFSDSHGYIDNCIHLIDTVSPDAVIHAGDCIRDCDKLMTAYPRIPMHCVCGNNDFSVLFPMDLTVFEESKKIFITHGHKYFVKYENDYKTLKEKASNMNIDMCVFGHTHKPYNDIKSGLILLNPGSIRYTSTYGICEICDGNIKASVLKAY